MKNLNALYNSKVSWRLMPAALVLIGGSAVAMQVDDAVVNINDSDGDRIVDTVDVDDDNDGVPDVFEITSNGFDTDSDQDGMPDRLDLDSDNDGILDWMESGAVMTLDFSQVRVVSGRLLGEVGTNGYLDILETSLDNGQPRYTLVNSDFPGDDLPDIIDLDSDNDGLSDLIEAGVIASFDVNNDARIDSNRGAGSVGDDGIPDQIQRFNDETCCDVNGDGIDDVVPRNSDSSDLPDFQDTDSDNDGIPDLVEAGGSDFDRDGRVDNFFDSPVIDGIDDAILLIPFERPDNNGNGVEDFIDQFAQAGVIVAPVQPSNVVAPGTATTVTTLEQTVTTPAPPAVLEEPLVVAMDEPLELQSVDRDPVPRPGDSIILGAANGPAEDDPNNGFVTTGLNAAGCSVQSTGVDLLLLLLAVFSMTILGWRFSLRRIRH